MWKRLVPSSRPKRRRGPCPTVEAVEARMLLATFTVLNTGNSGPGSLRQAILDSNAEPATPASPNVIQFAIDTGPKTISTLSALPAIATPTFVNGLSQPGVDPATAAPIVQINGQGAGVTSGLIVTGGNSVVAGLVISGFALGGVTLTGEGGNTVVDCYLGTNLSGTAALGNGNGINILESSGNTIGGTTPGLGNLISGNRLDGVFVRGASASGNVIVGNRIGLNRDGTNGLGNGAHGVELFGAPGNTVGGSASGARNLISANAGNGVQITQTTATGNVVQGNFVGIDINNNPDLFIGNSGIGVSINDAPGNLVGGAEPGAGNVLSHNLFGLAVQGASASGNRIQGNFVGTDATGAVAAANLTLGVVIASPGNQIGGTAPGAGNLMSGNFKFGLTLFGEDAHDNVVEGNLIGTDITGRKSLNNNGPGLIISNSASNNRVGGTSPGARNLISGNFGDGVQIVGGGDTPTAGNVLQGNFIGTDIDGLGTASTSGSGGLLNGLANIGNGVLVSSAPGNVIGGATPEARNIISGNQLSGIALLDSESTGNVVQGNYIGTDVTGLVALNNLGDGILIGEAPDNRIGGAATGEGNLISGNRQNGIEIVSPKATGNRVEGNLVGTDATGLKALGNRQKGISIQSGQGNRIGGNAPGEGNVISGNLSDGVQIMGADASGNRIAGNIIGLDRLGNTRVGNAGNGVAIDGAPRNVVGGDQPGARNVISGNRFIGLLITGHPDAAGGNVGAVGNVIQGNYIGTDATGAVALGNVLEGVFLVNAQGNVVGGASPSAGNVVSGNNSSGIRLFDRAASGNLIRGNIVGLDAAGKTRLGNARDGILIDSAPGNTVGGTAAGEGNVVSGNNAHGIEINGADASGNTLAGNRVGTDATGRSAVGNRLDGVLVFSAPGTVISGGNTVSGNARNGVEIAAGSSGTVVRGNRIGTDPSGKAALGNGLSGVLLGNASGNVIGGGAAGQGNVIASNGLHGVHVFGAAAKGNRIAGNLVGVDVSGLLPLGNVLDGVALEGAPGNVVGGAGAGEGNVIGANLQNGVRINGAAASGNVVQGNAVGVDRAGAVALGNRGNGVLIENSPRNLVATDLISANALSGVQITGGDASGNVVTGCTIGADLSGTVARPNDVGVFIQGASGNVVGGRGPGQGNLISGNVTAGVYLFGRFTSANRVEGNVIGTDRAGRKPLSKTSPQSAGVLISQAPGTSASERPAAGNVIGGSAAGAGNLIGGNTVGVLLVGPDTKGNVVDGNRIGVTTSGGLGAGNTVGVYLNSAPSNVIGGPAGNVISGNSSTGVFILGSLASGNVVVGNRIGTDPSGKTAVPNLYGVYVQAATGTMIGGGTASSSNVISGNDVGVYIFDAASGNRVRNNNIGANAAGMPGPGNRQYGVLLFNAAGNTVDQSGTSANRFFGNRIANVREFTSTRGAPSRVNGVRSIFSKK